MMSPPRDCARTELRPLFRLMPARVLVLAAAAALTGCEEQIVTAVNVASVEVSPPEITLVEGDQTAASAILREAGGREVSGRTVAWTVDDPEVATVTSDGVVEARAPGSTVIHATIAGVTGSATVSVLAGPAPPTEQGSCIAKNRTFPGDVEIAENTTCVFTNVRIRGDLKLARGSTFEGSDVRVDGNVEAKAASRLTLIDSRLDGDVEFEEGGRVDVRRSEIDGNLRLESNDGRLNAVDNRIDGNVQVFKNTGGPFTLSDNRIDGNLQCKENVPQPTGGGNVVDGNKEDQCSDL